MPHEPLPRPSARDTCFWYQALHVARARASCRYRVGNLVESLGGPTAVLARSLPLGRLRGMRTIVCIRPLASPNFVAELEELKRRGMRLIADFDDLLFSRRATGLPKSALGSDGSRPDDYRSVLAWFDEFTASTEPLCERVSEVAPAAPVHCVPNGPSRLWIEQGRALYRRWQPGDPKVIRYFSGSPSHDADLALVAEPLVAFLARHGDVSLELVGSFASDELPITGPRVKRIPWVRYDALPELLASAWLNLAPLSENDFNQCKSAIKLLEAGAFGCPTLASPNPDIDRHRRAGANVLLCPRAQDWAEALQAMLDDERRQQIGQSLEDYVQKKATASESARAFSALSGAA